MDNIEEKDKFLERYHLLRLNHEETENKNTPVTSNKIESVIQNSHKTRTQASKVNSAKHLEKT